VAGVGGLELRNVVANYLFERSHRFTGIQPNSGFGDYSGLSAALGIRSSGVAEQTPALSATTPVSSRFRTALTALSALLRLPTGHEQRLHVSASRHLRVRWLKPLAQFAFGNERAREKEGLFQIAGLAQGSIKKGITEIVHLALSSQPNDEWLASAAVTTSVSASAMGGMKTPE
jgi:hypothetical protein